MLTDVGERTQGAIDRLKAMVLADPRRQAALAALESPRALAEAAAVVATSAGIALSGDDLMAKLRPDPLGLSRFAPPNPVRPDRAAPGWLPVAVKPFGPELLIDWAYFGDRALRESFYEMSFRPVLGLPFNQLFGFQTALSQLPAFVADLDLMEPAGFIFHVSRCGSTLAAQMLAASPANVVVSEAAPIDFAAQVARADPAAGVPLLSAMVRAFGQRRDGRMQRLIVKLDCWHTLALPQFRQAFPNTPFVFMYRDPIEVMVSQHRQRGIQMVPDYVPPAFYGLTLDGAPNEDYWAQVLASVCEAVLSQPAEAVTLVNYAEMPEGMFSRILPGFGVTPGAEAAKAMAGAARLDSKANWADFKPDSETKRQEATAEVKAATARRLQDPYARLEARRAAQIGAL